MKQKWNCKLMFSNRNPQHQDMSLRKPESTKSLKLRITISLIMTLRCSQFLTFYWTKRSSRLPWRSKRNMNLKKYVSSNMSITSADSSRMPTGSKKSREKSQGSSRRTRLWTMPERRESSSSTPCRSCNAWTSLRISYPWISKRACSIWLTKITGGTLSRISWMWTSKTGCMTPLLEPSKTRRNPATLRMEFARIN